MSGYVPPGWPERVRPPGASDWEDSAAAFLFDSCPHDFRAYPVLRRHPVVLARFAAIFVESQLDAAKSGLEGARAELRDLVAPEVVEASVAAWQDQASALRRRLREVFLVEAALRGRRFVRRL